MSAREPTARDPRGPRERRLSRALVRHDRRWRALLRGGAVSLSLGLALAALDALQLRRSADGDRGDGPLRKAWMIALVAGGSMLVLAERHRRVREAVRGRYVPGLEPPVDF